MYDIKIRYNTKAKPEDTLHWRVLINGVEHLASHVEINTQTKTTTDFIEGVGTKWHISCKGNIQWTGSEIKIF